MYVYAASESLLFGIVLLLRDYICSLLVYLPSCLGQEKAN